jgi:hypothetical protein
VRLLRELPPKLLERVRSIIAGGHNAIDNNQPAAAAASSTSSSSGGHAAQPGPGLETLARSSALQAAVRVTVVASCSPPPRSTCPPAAGVGLPVVHGACAWLL